MDNIEKKLEIIENSINKKCDGLKCKVVKNNIDLRLENIQLKKQIDLILDKINQNYSNIFDKYENNEIKEIYENNKNNIKLTGLEFRKFCIKQYFEKQLKEK